MNLQMKNPKSYALSKKEQPTTFEKSHEIQILSKFCSVNLYDYDLTQQVGKQCHDNFFGPRYKLQSIYIIQHRIQK